MIDGANGRAAPEVDARRSFLRAAAAERGPRTPVPPELRHVYDSWVRATIMARHGRASDVHLGLHAFVLAHSLGLPSTRTRESFFELAYGAADAIACMAAAGLLRSPLPTDAGGGSGGSGGGGCGGAGPGLTDGNVGKAAAEADAEAEAEAEAVQAVRAWLGGALAAYDARLSLCAAIREGDLAPMARWLGAEAGREVPNVSGLDEPIAGLDEPMPGWPPTGLTCLHVAARAGRSAAVGWLLDRGAEPELNLTLTP